MLKLNSNIHIKMLLKLILFLVNLCYFWTDKKTYANGKFSISCIQYTNIVLSLFPE